MGPHYAEKRQPLGQRMRDFRVWPQRSKMEKKYLAAHLRKTEKKHINVFFSQKRKVAPRTARLEKPQQSGVSWHNGGSVKGPL